MRLGLAGVCAESDPRGALARALWATGLFSAWLVARHRTHGMDGMDTIPHPERLYSLGSCQAAAKKFLHFTDAVVSVGDSHPGPMFYHATCTFGHKAAVLAFPDANLHPRGYARRYATLTVDSADPADVVAALAGIGLIPGSTVLPRPPGLL